MREEAHIELVDEMIGYVRVRVLYAADRQRTGNSEAAEFFGAKRGQLSYGHCDVNIPRKHRVDELESPSLWRFEVSEDPTRHVVLLSTVPVSMNQFFAGVAARVNHSGGSNAFVFVHGYNVSFEDAARRTAQISFDLGFDGAPVFYSWRSAASTAAYTVDEQNIEWSQPNLRAFLHDFFARTDAQNIYLVAHSMGNRTLTKAVASLLTEQPSVRERLKEIILTAPDIDAAIFKRDIAPKLIAAGRPIMLYVSFEDLALVASKQVHGYARAGDSGEGLVIMPGIETIDATGTDTSLLGHSYFAEANTVLSDILDLI